MDEESFVDSGDAWRVFGKFVRGHPSFQAEASTGRSPESRCVGLVALAVRGVADACQWEDEWHGK